MKLHSFTQGGGQMIEAAENSVQGDIFDCLRMFDEEVNVFKEPDKVGTVPEFKLNTVRQVTPKLHAGAAEIKKA